MSPLLKVLFKVLVAKFYERNAGLFLFVFFLMFGIVESGQIINYHLSLIYGVLSSPIFLLVVCCVWLVYMLKCLQFVGAQLAKPENLFLFQLARMNWNNQFGYMLFVVVLIYEPVLIYSAVIIGVGFHGQFNLPSIEILSFHLVVIVLATWQILYPINRQHGELKFFKLPTIPWRWPKPFPFFYLGQLFTQLPTVLFSAKAFSIFSIYGFLQITLDHYENRVALMGLLFGLAAHAVIVFEFRKFEESHLLFLRNLPLSIAQRFVSLASVYILLLLPEMVMLIVNRIELIDIVGIYFFGIGILLLSHSRLYIELDNDKHVQWTLGLFLTSFMLVLFKIYWLELLGVWLLSLYYFRKHYYRFELKPE